MPFKIINKVIRLSEIVRSQKWGTNKLIYSGGVRISDNLKLWKDWEIIRDPSFVVDKNCFIGTSKGKKIIRISI